MNFFSPLWIALSTYSILPAPRAQWSSENMKSAICFLPVVGIFIGAALILWQWVCLALHAEPAFFAAAAAILPVIITGGIHMDGFMDTADALSSHYPMERKLEIMKDPHIGAFSVIWCALYLLMNFGLYTALYNGEAFRAACLGFMFSRALCAVSALTFPGAKSSGMLYAFTQHAKNRFAAAALRALCLLIAVGMAFIDFSSGLCGAVFGAAAFFIYRHIAKKQFGGVTGDTSGFFILLCEFCVLFGVWIGGLI